MYDFVSWLSVYSCGLFTKEEQMNLVKNWPKKNFRMPCMVTGMHGLEIINERDDE